MQQDSRKHDRAAVSMLSVVITEPSQDTNRHGVLDVSEHGMLVDALILPVGARIDFVLEDSPFNYFGRGHVAHQTGTAAGIAVDHWHSAPEAIRDLVGGDAQPRAQWQDGYVTEADYVTEDGYVTEWSRVSARRVPLSPNAANGNRAL